MDFTKNFAKLFIFSGIILIVIGILLNYSDKFGWLGKLPGDIYIKKENFTFSFPIVTCIVISLLITIIMYLLKRN